VVRGAGESVAVFCSSARLSLIVARLQEVSRNHAVITLDDP
jgi:hypothetical protein